MPIQYSVAVRDDQNDSFEVTTGASPKLQLRTGAPPAACASAASGTMLCEINLPTDWMGASASGVKALLGIWSGTGAAAGTVGHYRLLNNAATACHMQGTVTATNGGGDMTLDNVVVAVSQAVTTNTFTITRGNA